MKPPIARLLCLLPFLLLGFVQSACAQGCRLDYTPNYDTYTTVTTDGTNLYTTVLIDGSTSGSGGAGCSYPNAMHTPQAYNLINSTGGWVYGTAGHMTSYLTTQNDQQLNGPPDGSYTFSSEGEVICSVFGDFYDAYFPGQLWRLSVTYGTNIGYHTYNAPPPNNKYCDYQVACTSLPPGQLAPTCPPSPDTTYENNFGTSSCNTYVKTRFISTDFFGPRICVGAHQQVALTTPGGPCS